MRDRLMAAQVWERMELPKDECLRLTEHSETMREFRKLLFSKIVPNVKKLGLLTPWLRGKFAELDVLKFEDWETTDNSYLHEAGEAPAAA